MDFTTNIIEFARELKRRVRLEDVIEETIQLERHSGRGWTRGAGRGAGVHGLVVDLDKQRFAWNGNGDYGGGRYGDVIEWIECRDHVDFIGALQTLARKAGMSMPEFKEQDPAKRAAFKVQQNTFDIAQRLFEKWLLEDEQALEYLHNRGITDDTIRLVTLDDQDKIKARGAGLGFSGRMGDRDVSHSAAAACVEAMKLALQAGDVPLDSPAAVGILGLKEWNGLQGTEAVTGWGRAHGIEPKGTWISNGRIPGLMSVPGVIFPHIHNGSVEYFSRRNLPGFDVVGAEGEKREWKSFNLPNELTGGKKELYFNHAYWVKANECVVVEGQMDAVTLGQWGISAVATAGVGWSNEYTQDELKHLALRHETLYLAYDRDGAGVSAIEGKERDYPIADVVGALARIVEWPDPNDGRTEDGKAVKDANDLRQYYIAQDVNDDTQERSVWQILRSAKPIALWAAKQVGRLERSDPQRMKVEERVFRLLAKEKNRIAIEQLRTEFADETGFGFGLREFNNLLAKARKEKPDEDDGAPPIIKETMGEWVEDGQGGGYLLEYIYDPTEKKGLLAYRTPDKHFGKAKFIDINKVRYVAHDPDPAIIEGAVIYPSDIGELKKGRELAATVEFFIRKYFLFDNPLWYKMAAYYVMLTWLYDRFPAIPYLRFRGGTDTGKSEAALRIGFLCYRMIISTGISTTASWKDAIHVYKGTLFADEMDITDKFDDRIVLLNVGAMKKQAKVWKMVEGLMPDGTRRQRAEMANVYGPKIITMYGKFRDEATENRCVTFELTQHSPLELKKKGVPQELPPQYFTDAATIRNMLLRWRMELWTPDEFQIPESLTDYTVSTRHNQVTRPLKYLAWIEQDDDMQADIEMFVRASYHQSILERSMGLDARVLDAVVGILEDPKYEKYLMIGNLNGFVSVKYALTRDIGKVANEIMDEMNIGESEDDSTDELKKRRKGMTTKTTGEICRTTLMLPAYRTKSGYVIIFDEDKIEVAKIRYGLTDSLKELPGDETAKNAESAKEGTEQAELFDDSASDGRGTDEHGEPR